MANVLEPLARHSVLSAISERDRVGRDVFLKKYRITRAAQTNFIVHDGVYYDLKAVALAAYQTQFPDRHLNTVDFNTRAARSVLTALGFEIEIGAKANDGDTEVPRTMERFQTNLDREVERSQKNPGARKARLKSAATKPDTFTVITTVFRRNADVIAEVLERADGRCEHCRHSAPFLRRNDNSPYLEVHHKLPLADGGDDTVANALALCPNCHREAHFGKAIIVFR